MDANDLGTVWLTLKLASVVTLLLLLLGTPIAWWLARTRSSWKGAIAAVVALPLVLPPTVLGFYLLLAMGPNGYVGKLTAAMGLGILPFTFPGLVIASVFYSLQRSPRCTAIMDNLSVCIFARLQNIAVHRNEEKIDIRLA